MYQWLQLHGPLIVIALGGLITVFGGFLTSGRERRGKGVRGLTHDVLVVALGTLISIGGTYWAGSQELAFQADVLTTSKENARLNRALAAKSSKIADLSQEVAQKSDIIAEKEAEIARLSEENLDWATGGNGYCFLAATFPLQPRAHSVSALLAVQSRYPLREVHVHIIGFLSSGGFPYLTDRDYGTLPPSMIGRPQTTLALPLPPSGWAEYQVSISMLQHPLMQLMAFVKANGEWLYATRVTDLSSKAIVFEKVDKRFPRTAGGKVKWPI